MTKAQTHYRKAFNSPYLSAADIVEPTVLNIESVKLLADSTNKSKDSFNTAYFVEKEIRPGEKLKPMILNVHNSKVMCDMCGSPFIEDWHGTVTVYVDQNVRFGRDVVEGLRIKAGAAYITEDQATHISDLMKEVEADKAMFLNYFKAKSIETIPASSYKRAVAGLEKKRGS